MLRLMTLLAGCLLLPAAYGLELQGEFQQGGLLVGQVAAGEQVTFAGRKVRVAEDGRFVIGVGRDAPTSVALQVTDASGVSREESVSIDQREYRIQRIEGVPQRTVTPPKEVLERIRKESAQVRAARANDSERRDFLAGFHMPMEGPITGVYGSQRVYNGVPKNPHYGLDIAGPTGKLVHSPAAGVVTLVHRDMYFSGGTLIVDHGHGIYSTFIHLSDILVQPGARVEVGDAIAKVGSTGRSTGPHLDWRINWFNVRLDPELVMKALPASE